MNNLTPEEVGKSLKDMFKDLQNGVVLCKVESVDKEKVVCVAARVDEPEMVLQNIRLRATDDEQDDGFVLFPRKGSYILVGKTQFFDAYYVAMFSEIDEIRINGGKLGGLVIGRNLVQRLNTIENALNTLKNLLTSWTPVPSDGGAALKTILGTWASQALPNITTTDIENDKIKQ